MVFAFVPTDNNLYVLGMLSTLFYLMLFIRRFLFWVYSLIGIFY